MIAFSASDAALSGFAAIREHWRLLVGWAVFNLLALVVLVVLVTILSVGIVAATGGRGDAQVTGELIGGLGGGLGMLAVEAVLAAGILRTLLAPPTPGFLNLRVGKAEGCLILGWLALWVIYGLPLAVGMAIGSAGALGSIVTLVAVVVLAVASIYFTLRFSFTAPVAVAERRVGLARSWRLSKGHVLPLLGMVAMTVCMVAIVALLGWLLMLGVTGALFGFDNTGLFGLGDADELKASPGPFLFQLAAQLLFAPVFWTLALAPIASAYQAFTAET